MQYQWEIETIKGYKKYYRLLLKEKGISSEKRNLLKKYMENLEDMELVIKNGYQPVNENKRVTYQDKEKWIPLSTYREAQYIHPKIEKIMIRAMRSTARIRDTYNNIELPRKDLAEEDLINMAQEFAQWIPDKYYQKEIERYIDEKKHLIQFSKPIDKDEMGVFYPFHLPGYRPFLLINRLNTIEDFSTLNHELAHSVFYRKDDPSSENSFLLNRTRGVFL